MTTSPDALLEHTWFAADMPVLVRARLARMGRVVRCPMDATVIGAGLPAPALGVLIDGRIALRLAVPGVAQRTILTLEAGDVFGWSSLLRGSTATSSAVTLTPATVVLFDREELAAAMAEDCELAAAVYQRVLGAVARRLQATRLQLLDLYRPGDEPW